MPRRMRSATPYGLGLQAPAAQQPISTNWKTTLGNYAQQYGPHIIPGLLSTLGGAAAAYGAQNPQVGSPLQQQPVPMANGISSPTQQPTTPTIAPEMQQETTETPQMQLSDLLSHLISHRVDMMGSMMPTYPDRLFSQAVSASNSQSGSPQGPPRYTPTGPQFAFDQTLGGGASYSPLSALGDFSVPQSNREWWRTGANQLGGLLQGLAPLAGTYGGLPGILGGAALGATGYGLQQL